MRPLEVVGAAARRRIPARAPDDRASTARSQGRAACSASPPRSTARRSTSAPARRSSSRPAGRSGNVNFRRMFDPRLTEEYCGLAGMPWSDQDASGELAAMAIGASLWGLSNYASETGSGLTKAGEDRLPVRLREPHLDAGKPRLRQGARLGTARRRLAERHHGEHDWPALLRRDRRRLHRTTSTTRSSTISRTATSTPKNVKYNPNNFINAALAGIGDGHNGGGPIWAIFDADAVARERWDAGASVRRHRERLLLQRRYARGAGRQDPNAIPARADAAGRISRRRSRATTPSSTSASTRTSASRSRCYKIAKPPFYAAWATPVIHDTRAGLRINANCQVVDMNGDVIPRLYCGGESAGGFSMHGLARCLCQGTSRAVGHTQRSPSKTSDLN